MTENSTTFVFETAGEGVDHGLFGPDSVAWRVWSHPAAFVGVIRSFLTEMLASPEGAQALVDSRLYRTDSIGRLQRTMHYFLTVVFADTATVDQANLRLSRMHQQISGSVPLTGGGYDGRDPFLMLATHVMTWHSVWVAYESLAGARPGEAERYFVESARAASALGLDAMSADEFREHALALGYDAALVDDYGVVIPETREQFGQFHAMTSTRWCITPGSRDILDTLLRPRANTFRQSMEYRAYGVLADAAAALLPRRMRNLASMPTGRTWETQAILAGRAALRATNLPMMKRRFEHSVSPRGYQCVHAAQGLSRARNCG
jgi:uncharacterized protein (DUF2236 family)